MGIEIRPTSVAAQIQKKDAVLDSVSSECNTRRQKVTEFCADSTLTGDAWSMARQRLGLYSSLLMGLTKAAESIKAADSTVSSELGVFGAAEKVSEDEWTTQRDDADRAYNQINKEIDPRVPTSQDAGLHEAADQWLDARNKADDMLNKIHDYDNRTKGAFSDSSLIDAVQSGIDALASSRPTKPGDDNPVPWKLPDDTSWMDVLKNQFNSGVDSLDDLYNNGTLDEDKLKSIFDKPIDLWTEDEIRVINELYNEAGKQAIDGNSDLLNKFLNAGYYQSESPHRIDTIDRPDGDISIDEGTYSMREGFAGFLISYVAAMQAAGFYGSKPLSERQYILTGIADGLLTNAQQFHVDLPSAAASQMAPNIKVEFNNNVDQREELDVHVHGATVTFGSRYQMDGSDKSDHSSKIASVDEGGFMVLTTPDASINTALAELQAKIANPDHDNEKDIMNDALWNGFYETATSTILEKIPGIGELLSEGYDIASIFGDANEAVQDQRDKDAVANSIRSISDLDVTMKGAFYGNGAVVSSLDGSNARAVAPGFASSDDRKKHEEVISLYLQDTNGQPASDRPSFYKWCMENNPHVG